MTTPLLDTAAPVDHADDQTTKLLRLIKELAFLLEETISDAEKIEKLRLMIKPWRGVL